MNHTTNRYFVGGIGDLSVMLDPDSRDLYFFYSQYLRPARWQGIAIARMAWADRDEPVGKVMVWRGMWCRDQGSGIRDQGKRPGPKPGA